MTDDGVQHDAEPGSEDELPNASPELQDAIRSIDAIGENARGRDEDEDATRQSAPDESGASGGSGAPSGS